MKFSHFTAGFVLFAVLVGLLVGFYNGLVDDYGIVPGDVKDFNHTRNVGGNNGVKSGNIAEQFNSMSLVQGISKISEGFSKLYVLKDITDFVGGLLMAGLGTLQTVMGVIILPYELFDIIITFYAGEVPGVLGGITAMVIVYAGFVFLSIKVGRDL